MCRQGNAETDYPVLLLDSVSLILTLAIADDALSLKDLTAMLRGKGEGPVDWNEHALDVPICRHIHRNGDVDPNESMHEDRLRQILSQLLEKEAYVGVAPRIHSIRREVGRQLDSKCYFLHISIRAHNKQNSTHRWNGVNT